MRENGNKIGFFVHPFSKMWINLQVSALPNVFLGYSQIVWYIYTKKTQLSLRLII